jgi:hypothetical protein
MKACQFAMAVSIAFPLAADAGDLESPRSLAADLDRDGRAEQITWEKFATTEDDGDFYRVLVTDNDGSLLWESPSLTDTENPLVFGSWHFGISLPELAADIDGDGAIELVAPAPQSDVSPTSFRTLRWQGGRFVVAHMGILLETPRGSGQYPWSQTDQWQGAWISSFEGINPDGSLLVAVFAYVDETTRAGKANVIPGPKGFQLRDWAVPLKSLSDPQTSTPTGQSPPSPPPPPAQGNPKVYHARLSTGDHFNSKGVRLEEVSAILRQDRANFYKGNGDPEDNAEPFFSTTGSREQMQTMTPVAVGAREGIWRETIINGSPLVEIEIAPKVLKVRILAP